MKALEEELSLSQEVVLTLLSHLQLSFTTPPLRVMNSQHDTAEISFVRAYDELERLSPSSPLLQHLVTSHLSPSTSARAFISLCDVSNALQWTVVELQAELMRLKGMGEFGLQWSDDSIIVRVEHQPLGDEEEVRIREGMVELVMGKQRVHEERRQLHTELMIHSMHAVAGEKEDVHELMRRYFEREGPQAHAELLREVKNSRGLREEKGEGGGIEGEWVQVEASVRSFLDSGEAKEAGVAVLTAKSVCLILHGLHTLSSTQSVWGKSRWWGKWKKLPFGSLEELVQRVLEQWRDEEWNGGSPDADASTNRSAHPTVKRRQKTKS